LRELRFLHEEEGQAWAGELSRFLLHWNERLEEGQALGEKAFQRVHRQFRALLAKGRRLHPRQKSRAQSKASNLLTRLEDYDLSVLAFLLDPDVPFTNNTSERDMRHAKVRQKISGCFRTLDGARVFARMRGYISTCRKQKQNILQALHEAFLGNPVLPTALPRGP
jgi:transposase